MSGLGRLNPLPEPDTAYHNCGALVDVLPRAQKHACIRVCYINHAASELEGLMSSHNVDVDP